MQKKSYSLAQIILYLFPVLILLHITALVFYLKEHEKNLHEVNINVAIQKILDIIDIAHITPKDRLPDAISAFNSPFFQATISDTPKWQLQTDNTSYSNIHKLISNETNFIRLSILLNQNTWLNIKIPVGRGFWAKQIGLIILEIVVASIIFFYVWSLKRFTDPLRDFRQTAERLGVDIETNLPETQYKKGPIIVQETAEAMKKMQQRIQELLNDRTQMLAAISHDLRTPITRIKLRSDLISDPEISQAITKDLNEMNFMIDEILTFARGNYDKHPKTKIDINSLIESVCDDIDQSEEIVQFSRQKKYFPIMGDALTLKRVFTNLITNAIKYGNVAKVHTKQKENSVEITVDDEGPGIPEAEFEKVFQPFYRCDQSRSSRKVSGTGLGLTIARDAIKAHHGTIELQNLKPNGLRVVVTLPLHK